MVTAWSGGDRRLAERYRWNPDVDRRPPGLLPVRLNHGQWVPIRNISVSGVLVGNLRDPPQNLVLVLDSDENPSRPVEIDVSLSGTRFEGVVLSIAVSERNTVHSVIERLSRGGMLKPVGGRRPEWSLNVQDHACFESGQCPIWPDSCRHCGCPIPRVHHSLCPNPLCRQPVQYPNIVDACREERRRAVAEAFREGTRDWTEIAQKDARIILSTSAAVLACDAELMLAVLWGVAKFPNYHDMVARSHRPPDGPEWDYPRDVYDESVFPGYKDQIRFAALSLDGRSVRRFGSCIATLREDVLRRAASVFVENSFFARVKAAGPEDSLPAARASWLHRDVLTAAKLGRSISAPVNREILASMILIDGPPSAPQDDQFVEVHVFGPIGAEAVTEVSVPATEAKLEDIREACQRNRIRFRVRPST